MPRPTCTAALAVVFALCRPADAKSPAEVFAAVHPAVPVLETFAADGRLLAAASAIALGGGRFVTLCSPLHGSDAIRLAADGRTAAATVRARDLERNLCLLSAPEAGALPALPLAPPEPPAAGARVFAISNALGFGTGISEGVVAGIRSGDGGDVLQFSAPIAPGAEGGALVDAEGRLLGVIDYRQRDGQNVNFAAPAAWIAGIERRQDADVARQALRDHAPRLARDGDGAGLARLAAEWTTRHPDDADGWTWRAVAAALQGDFAAEEHAWRQAGQLAPQPSATGLGIAGALLRQRRFDDARDAAQAVLVQRQEDPAAWALLGQAEHGRGALAEAEAAYRRALALDPWQTLAHEGLIGLAQQRGDHAAAIDGWTGLARLYPERPLVRWRLVESLLLAKDGARAHAVLARLPAALADSADGLFWRGATAALLDRPQQAIELLRASLAANPSEPARAWTELGKAYFVLQRFPEAITAHREAVRLAPTVPGHRYWLAVALKDGGHVGEALALDRQLVAELPDDTNTWRQLGYAAATAARVEDAIAALERAVALEPAQPRAWNALMMLYRAARRDADLMRAHAALRGLDAAMAERAYLATIKPYEVRTQ